MVEKMGKKWGLYHAGGRSQPVSCIYCGRLTPKIKAVPVRKGPGIDLRNIPGLDRRQVFLPYQKGYACISCAKHRRMI
jgi:ribosomal protein S26